MSVGIGPAFTAAAKVSTPAKKCQRVAPLSVRVSAKERAEVERLAAGRSMNAYLRDRLFGADATPARTRRGLAPVKDYEALGRALGLLGKSDVFTALTALRLAMEEERFRVSDRTEADIRAACDAVQAIRGDLIKALGLRGG